MKRYREYLAEQKKEEEEKEREVDEMVSAEVERQWAQRIAQWRKEKEARRKLMQEVIETRQEQIKQKCMSSVKNMQILILCHLVEDIAEKKKEIEREAQEMADSIALHHQLESEHSETIRQKNLKYQQDLIDQMTFQEILKEKKKEELLHELAMTEEAEYYHQQRVQHALMNPDLKKTHPRKLLALGHH